MWDSIHYPVYLRGVLPTFAGPLWAPRPNQGEKESGPKMNELFIRMKADK